MSRPWLVMVPICLLFSAAANLCLWFVAVRMSGMPVGESLDEQMKRVKPAIVTLATFNPLMAMPVLGVGFFVSPDRIVSSRHLLARVDRAEVRTANGETLRVIGILAEDRPRDLVLLQVERAPAQVAQLDVSTDRPLVGARVSTVGAPLGFEWSVSDGIVSAYRDVPDGGTLMQHTAQISVGSSGGPILDSRGRVVAVQVATMTEDKATISAGQGLNFAVLARHVAALKPGDLRPLSDCTQDLPDRWVAPITADIARVSLRSLTCDGFEESLAYFEERTRRFPNEPDAWFRLARCEEIAGHLPGAKASYLKAIALRPSFSLALSNLGHVYNKLGLYEEAQRTLREALAADDTLALAHGNLAHALYRSGKYAQASTSAERALQLDPCHPGARYIKALCSARAGARNGEAECRRVLEELGSKIAGRLRRDLGEAGTLITVSQTGSVAQPSRSTL